MYQKWDNNSGTWYFWIIVPGALRFPFVIILVAGGKDGVGLLLSIILIGPFEHFEPAEGLFYLPYPVVS